MNLVHMTTGASMGLCRPVIPNSHLLALVKEHKKVGLFKVLESVSNHFNKITRYSRFEHELHSHLTGLDTRMHYTSYSELCYLQLFGDGPHQVAGVVVDVLDQLDEIGCL